MEVRHAAWRAKYAAKDGPQGYQGCLLIVQAYKVVSVLGPIEIMSKRGKNYTPQLWRNPPKVVKEILGGMLVAVIAARRPASDFDRSGVLVSMRTDFLSHQVRQFSSVTCKVGESLVNPVLHTIFDSGPFDLGWKQHHPASVTNAVEDTLCQFLADAA